MSNIEELKGLAELKEQGILTEEEFQKEKEKILSRGSKTEEASPKSTSEPEMDFEDRVVRKLVSYEDIPDVEAYFSKWFPRWYKVERKAKRAFIQKKKLREEWVEKCRRKERNAKNFNKIADELIEALGPKKSKLP